MEFYEVVSARRSVRRYRDEPVPQAVVERVLEAARIAPSAKNVQPWKYVLVYDEALRKQLVPRCHNQAFIAEAPIVVVACGTSTDGGMGGWISSLTVDVAIGVDHLTLAAAAEGLGTCWIGAFDAKAVKELLGIPDDVQVVTLTPLGYPATGGAGTKSRKPLGDIVCRDRWC